MPPLSIPRRYPFPAPRGERRVWCDYCGIRWYRSVCVRDRTGYLQCPDCNDGGKDLATMEAERMAAVAGIPTPPPDDYR